MAATTKNLEDSPPTQNPRRSHKRSYLTHNAHTQKLPCDHSLQAHELSLTLIAPTNRPSLALVDPAQKNASLPTHPLPSLCLDLVL